MTSTLSILLVSLSLVVIVLIFVQAHTNTDAVVPPVTAQENSTMTDQSRENTTTGKNLSGSDAAVDMNQTLSTLTREDLQPVLDNLFNAREQLLSDNILGSFDSVNLASSALFRLNSSLANSIRDNYDISLSPLQEQIESARASMLDQNNTLAIKYLNGADTEFIILSQELGSDGKANTTG